MSYYFPQATIELRILPEDFKLRSKATDQTYSIFCQARNVTVVRNDYKTSDTFTAEIDYKNFPFDPRTIRSCGVVVYMQDMRKLYKSDGSENRLVPGDPTDLDPSVTNAVFMGFVDDSEISFDDNGRKVSLKGRDMTALLIDQKYDTQKVLFFTKPLDVSIKTFLASVPALANIEVINNTDDPTATLPVPASLDASHGQKLGGGMNTGGGARENYWEIIQEIVGRCGLVCFMGITNKNGNLKSAIIITTPKNQARNLSAAGSSLSGVGETLDDIKIIYGQNIKSMSMKRKLGRLKNFNIAMKARVGKNVITARIPEEANADWCKKYGIKREQVKIPTLRPDGTIDANSLRAAPYITFPFPGNKITTHAQLVLAGQTAYEQYSLQMLEGTFETHEMLGRGTSKGSNFLDDLSWKPYDLTQIRKGQTICIEVDPQDLDGISRLSTEEQRADYLERRGYKREVASIFAQTIGKMSPRFMIKDYTMSVGQEDGFKLVVNFYNLVDNVQRNL